MNAGIKKPVSIARKLAGEKLATMVITVEELMTASRFIPLIRDLMICRLRPQILKRRREEMGESFDIEKEKE